VTRVLIFADSAVVRAGLEALLTGNPELSVVGHSLAPAALAERAEDLQADVLLVELEMQDDEAVTALAAMAAGPRAPAIVLLADDPTDARVVEALRSGVRAVLPRQVTPEEIVAAIEAAAAGLVVLHPGTFDSLLPVLPPGQRSPSNSPHQSLTPREIEVLGMLAEGLGNKTIAWRLGISEHTVKFHIASLFAKLNASSRTEAVTLGIRQGLTCHAI
jgi:NarL family two-component system response regulator YdfI